MKNKMRSITRLKDQKCITVDIPGSEKIQPDNKLMYILIAVGILILLKK